MKILYITFIDFGPAKSGSSLRPQRMYDAFLELGHEVLLLSGQQNRRKERKARVKEILKQLQSFSPDICYIEPPSGPFFCRIDLKLLRKVSEMGFPVGLFYRDAYWKFASWYRLPFPKKQVLTYLHKRDLKAFQRYCDILYFPSDSMSALFSHKNKRTLPPAAPCREPVSKNGFLHNVIYVGGVSERYGTHILLEAMRMVNEERKQDITLTLVCDEKAIRQLYPDVDRLPYVHIVSAQGDEALAPLYAAADFGIYSGVRDLYMDFAVPVKLFEYMGFSLPVVSTNPTEAARLIETTASGLVCEDDSPALAQAILEMYQDESRFLIFQQNAIAAARENSWISRAGQIIKELSQIRDKDV